MGDRLGKARAPDADDADTARAGGFEPRDGCNPLPVTLMRRISVSAIKGHKSPR